MKFVTKAKPGIPRARTHSGTSLGPRDELLRESIRYQVASAPYALWTQQETWDEAKRLAESLHKTPNVVRKAIYNRRNFINRKIEVALIKYEVVDAHSPKINDIADMVETIACNVQQFLLSHHTKIVAMINAKNANGA